MLPTEKQVQELAEAIRGNKNPNARYKMDEGNYIVLPTGQFTGTLTQQATYAETKAREVLST